MCDCSALRFDDHLPVAYQDQFLHWLAFARDFGSWLKRSPTADFDKLRQLFPAQTGKGALAEQMQCSAIAIEQNPTTTTSAQTVPRSAASFSSLGMRCF